MERGTGIDTVVVIFKNSPIIFPLKFYTFCLEKAERFTKKNFPWYISVSNIIEILKICVLKEIFLIK